MPSTGLAKPVGVGYADEGIPTPTQKGYGMVDLSHKGKVFPAYTFTIERGKVREFALAIDDPNPAYIADDNRAVPPTFPTVLAFWGPMTLEMALKEIGVEIFNVLHSEQEYEYFSPLKVGDSITVETRITDIYTREGRSSKMEFVEFLTDYTNQAGEPVLKERALIIVRS